MGREGSDWLRRGLARAGRRRVVGVVAVGALVCAAMLVALLALDSSDGATSGPSSSPGATGTVERRTLAERVTATGKIGYAGETTVLARLSGTVTELPAVGDVIRRGRPLYALAGAPVLLMYGSVPAYRTLADGVPDGKDVAQLKANLVALGYEPGAVDEEFTYTTTEAVIAWQEALGLKVSGEVELGRVTFLPGPQRVTGLEATLGEALAGGGGNTSTGSSAADGASGSTALIAWHPETEAQAVGEEQSEGSQEAAEERQRELEKQERELEHEREKLEREEEHAKERREREEVRSEKAKTKSGLSEQGAGASGSEAGGQGSEAVESEASSVPIMRTSSTRRIVGVELEADQQSIARRGQKVQVVLPGGVEVPGKVTGLAAAEASGSEGGQEEEEGEAGIEATISLTGRHEIPALDGASVSVRFTQQVRKQVLSVPLTALVAIGGERFAVHVLEGGARRQIVVVPGLAANGYVEVKGKGLEAGMQVETGE